MFSKLYSGVASRLSGSSSGVGRVIADCPDCGDGDVVVDDRVGNRVRLRCDACGSSETVDVGD